MPTETVENWGDAMMASLTGALAMLLGAVPRILGFLIIIGVGWFLARLLAAGVARVMRAVHFNDLADRSGFSAIVRRMGVNSDASGFLAFLTKWFIRIITLVVAFDALGLPAVSEVLREFLLWLPNLVVALVVLVIAGLAANAVTNVVRGATEAAGFNNPNFLAGFARGVVWAFGIIIAVNQLGIADELINTLFMAIVGAFALAAGLAFGLGGRDTAGEIVAQMYRRGREAAPKIQQAAAMAQTSTVGRGDQAAGYGSGSGGGSALEILQRRYAAGEISRAEYEQLRSDLMP